LDGGVQEPPVEAPITKTLFISLSDAQYNLQVDWAEPGSIPRQCPLCLRHSIVGHGRRCKQAHDHDHDWIGVRRGRCQPCHQTFTFLPPFSLPYTHYSLIEQSPRLLNETFNWEKDKRICNYCWWVCDSEDWPVNW